MIINYVNYVSISQFKWHTKPCHCNWLFVLHPLQVRRVGESGNWLQLYRRGSSFLRTVLNYMLRKLTTEGFVPLPRLNHCVTSFLEVWLLGGMETVVVFIILLLSLFEFSWEFTCYWGKLELCTTYPSIARTLPPTFVIFTASWYAKLPFSCLRMTIAY